MDWYQGYFTAFLHISKLYNISPKWGEVAGAASAIAAVAAFMLSQRVARDGRAQFLVVSRASLRVEALAHLKWVNSIGAMVEEYDSTVSEISASSNVKKNEYLRQLRDVMSELNALQISAIDPARSIILASHDVISIEGVDMISAKMHREQVRLEASISEIRQKVGVILKEFHRMTPNGKGGFELIP